ncbi:MAG: hypothetical protein PHS40_11050 [Mariniphaga sp.]|nr:hypothetical protein [Mariniphaga sp.]MDD4426453.1 hypothetical protein [Mariniphaga sp.]
MIIKDNFKELLVNLGFYGKGDTYTKKFREIDAYLKVNFKAEQLIYPEDKGLLINGRVGTYEREKTNMETFR